MYFVFPPATFFWHFCSTPERLLTISFLNLLRCCSFGTSCPLLAEYPESHQLTTDDLMVPAIVLPFVQILVATCVSCFAAWSRS